YHFTNYALAYQEYANNYFNPAHPASLLYTKNRDGYKLVGAMFSAPPQMTQEELDRRIPLSVARWHAHTNICLPTGISLNDLLRNNVGNPEAHMPGMLPATAGSDDINRRMGVFADGRFGFLGK